ncbi:MAG TPA: AAA family ATPase [Polyangia bacterium]|jgi:predicted ATPase
MAVLSPEQTGLLQEILGLSKQSPPVFPAEPEFRVLHVDQRAVIDDLVAMNAVARHHGYYVPTLAGLRALGTEDARAAIRRCNSLLEWLKEKVRSDPRKLAWTPAELCQGSAFSEDDVRLSLTILLVSGEHNFVGGWGSGPGAFATSVNVLLDGVLDAQPVPETEAPTLAVATGPGIVTRLYIHNFRSFVNFEWTPPAACVLVGDNGAGKSALIEVLWLLQDLVVDGKDVAETTASAARTVWLRDIEQIIEVDIDRGEESLRYRLGIRWEAGRSSITEELRGEGGLLYRAGSGKAELYGDRPSAAPRTTIPFDRRRSFIASLEARPDNRRIIGFRESIRAIWAMKPDPRNIGGSAGEESRYLERDLSNFASWYLARVPEDPDAAEALRADLAKVLAGFSTLRFEPISPEVKDLRVRFSFGGKSHELGWAKLSDGQRLLIALYGLLRFGLVDASLIALDEAENYVAPAEIQPWLRAVADAAAERKQQLLVVSHHPESINYLAANAAWRMWRDPDSGHTRIAPLLPDLDAGETAYDVLKLASPEGPEEAGPGHG